MHKFLYIFIFSIVTFLQHCYNQNTKEIQKTIKGRITDEDSHYSLAFIYIWNESKRIVSITDTAGYFRIKADVNDTLVLSALGYLGKTFIISSKEINSELNLSLTPRTYDIAEVKIVALGSYSQFKQKIINLKLPESKTTILRNNLNVSAINVAVEADNKRKMEKIASEGVTLASVPILSPEEKQRIKLKEILQDDKIQKIIDKKYNRQIVADLTKLKDTELDEFIIFCKFDKNYLLLTSQYDIMVKILEKFEDFKRAKKSSMIDYDPEFA